MHRYKVEYVHTEPDNKKWYKQKNAVDGWTLAKEIEALLAEYETKGYKVLSIESIESISTMGVHRTDGILVVFEKEKME